MKKLIVIFFLLSASLAFSQPPPKPYGPLPSEAQLNWQEMEMYCMVCFGVDTYTDKEWGFGDEDPKLIDPVNFNAEQIVGAAKAGGFKGVVIVAKHHDGLCLWPTKTTAHNISQTSWKNGQGDMLKEYQLACSKLQMKMGIYCSPWDRNNASYGKPEYLTIYQNQLKELLQNYGVQFTSWHDGANGGDGYYGGSRETRKIDRSSYYSWNTIFAIIRKMQPGAVIFGDAGPDVRWVGNEDGQAGQTCWETYTPHSSEAGKMPSNGLVKYWEGTEGTRQGVYWMPAECDVPLRPGWFYHQSQDGQTRTPYNLLDLYYKSVGRAACLDLGLAPDKRGLITDEDKQALEQFGQLLRQTFSVNLAREAMLIPSNVRANNKKRYGTEFLMDKDRYSYWATDDKVTNPTLTIALPKAQTFNVIRLRENIKLGQRIDSVIVDAELDGAWKEIAKVTSIGANRLIRLTQNITTNKLRLHIKAQVCIALSDFALYKEPVHLTEPDISRGKDGFITITTDAPVGSIHYTIDGKDPSPESPVYNKPILFIQSGTVKARSFDGTQYSETRSKVFDISKQGWTVTAVKPASGKGTENAIDENPSTLFNSCTNDSNVAFIPQEINVDVAQPQQIKAFTYLPRQDKQTDGMADAYSFQISMDGQQWTEVASGEFSNIKSNPLEQLVSLKEPVTARYFRFTALRVIKGNGVSIAELGIR